MIFTFEFSNCLVNHLSELLKASLLAVMSSACSNVLPWRDVDYMLSLGVLLHCHWCIRNWHCGPQSREGWLGTRSSLHHLGPNW